MQVVWKKGFIGVVAPREWDAIKAARPAEGHVVGCEAALPRHTTSSTTTSARRRSSSAMSTRRSGDVDAAFAKAAQGRRGDLRMAVPVACADGAGLRRRRREARQRATMWTRHRRSRITARDGVAKLLGLPTRESASRLDDRTGLLRPQRFRRCRHGRRRALEGGRQAGARAEHALRGPRLGPEGARLACTRRASRSTRTARSSAGTSSPKSSPSATSSTTKAHPAHTLAGQLLGLAAEAGAAVRRAGARATTSPISRRSRASSRRCSTAPRRCAPRICAIRAGRRRISPSNPSWMRSRSRSAGPGRVPPALCERPARPRRDQGRGREGRLAAAHRSAPQAAEWRRDDRPGHGLCVRARHARRHGRRTSRSTARPERVRVRKWTVAHDCGQIVTPDLLRQTIEGNIVQSDQPRAVGGSEVRRAQMSPASTGTAIRSLDIKDAPETIDIILIDQSGGRADRRRRGLVAPDRRRDRQRDLRCDGRPPAPRAAVAGARQGRHGLMQTEPVWTRPQVVAQSALILRSFRAKVGRALLPLSGDARDDARALFEAPFAVLAHGTEADPIFFYGNATALRLWDMSFEDFTRMPSRLSAEPMLREERQRLARKGCAAGLYR